MPPKCAALAAIGHREVGFACLDTALQPNLEWETVGVESVWWSKSLVLAELQRKSEAIEAFDHSLQIQPKDCLEGMSFRGKSAVLKRQAKSLDQGFRLDKVWRQVPLSKLRLIWVCLPVSLSSSRVDRETADSSTLGNILAASFTVASAAEPLLS